jgi:hypothetical protein
MIKFRDVYFFSPDFTLTRLYVTHEHIFFLSKIFIQFILIVLIIRGGGGSTGKNCDRSMGCIRPRFLWFL